MKRKNNGVSNGEGKRCELCGEISERPVHSKVTDTRLRQAYCYSEWYYFRNKDCPRSIFMDEQFKIFNKNDMGRYARSSDEIDIQLAFLREIQG